MASTSHRSVSNWRENQHPIAAFASVASSASHPPLTTLCFRIKSDETRSAILAQPSAAIIERSKSGMFNARLKRRSIMKTNRYCGSHRSRTLSPSTYTERNSSEFTDAFEQLKQQQRDSRYLIVMRSKLFDRTSGTEESTNDSNAPQSTPFTLRRHKRRAKRRTCEIARSPVASEFNSQTKLDRPRFASPCTFVFGGIELSLSDYLDRAVDLTALDAVVYHAHAEKRNVPAVRDSTKITEWFTHHETNC